MDAAEINTLIQKIKYGDTDLRNEFIESNRGFIRRTSSYICKRNLDWANDDELSIALMAFNESIDSFNTEKGADFYTYSRVLIKNRLIDYFRKNNIPHVSLNSMDEEELNVIETKKAIDIYSINYAANERSIEIKMFNNELSEYGISISDLTLHSPKHKDTRKIIYEAVLKCIKNKNIIKTLKKNKMLPIKEIIEITQLKRKFIEEWRRYMIALFIIMSSDEYLYLKEYIDFGDSKVVE